MSSFSFAILIACIAAEESGYTAGRTSQTPCINSNINNLNITHITTTEDAQNSGYNSHDFVLSLDIVYEVIGCYGMILISTFEYDPDAPHLRLMHNIGVILALFTLTGYIFQSYRL